MEHDRESAVLPFLQSVSRYHPAMATTQRTDRDSALPSEASVKSARAALLARRANRDAAERSRRAQAVREAGSGRRLGVVATRDLYR